MEQKPGWTYKFVESLNMQIAINNFTGIMYTEDKVKYSLEEQRLLQKIDFELPLPVHIVKKVFEGTIVSLWLFIKYLPYFIFLSLDIHQNLQYPEPYIPP